MGRLLINWLAGDGEYIVSVDYFSDCGITTPTNYLVTVRANGVSRTFSGQLVPADDDARIREVTRVIVQ